MEQRTVRVGILGCGVVGGGLYQLLTRNADEIARRTQAPVELAAVADIDWDRPREFEVPAELRSTDGMALCTDPSIDIIVETIGGIGIARKLVMTAIENGKAVVTSNKELMAKFGSEILDAARDKGVDVQFEGAVGGTIPIIRALHQSLEANRIQRILGIVNGTTNYILTKMSQEGREFAEVLAEAQALGYAEQDPTADVEGIDSQNKIAILAAIAFARRVNVEDVYREGISKITPTDIEYARRMGYVIKLLAIASRHNDQIEVRVHPALVPRSHPLASVDGVFNAIFVQGDACDDVMLYGRGAGALPTASAVAGDVIDCARNILRNARGRVPCTCESQANILPMDDVVAKAYVRMRVKDRPGVLGSIATILGQEGVSIASVIQEANVGDDLAEIVWVMHPGPQRNLRTALAAISNLGIVDSIPNVIRVVE
ncbi:MAG: homoserine dehydrogenase [Armatimonadetes bacterium]|nr:homoserine dehydrogenase [Armatimonadota bacterium]